MAKGRVWEPLLGPRLLVSLAAMVTLYGPPGVLAVEETVSADVAAAPLIVTVDGLNEQVGTEVPTGLLHERLTLPV
jgi:hypothetical protein